MVIDPERAFASLLNEARDDPDILAFWLDGSRGKGLATDYSDYDCTIIVEENVSSQYTSRYRSLGSIGIDLSVMTLAQFRDYAAWGSNTGWARYNFTHLFALVDKTRGEVQRLIDDKGRIPVEVKANFIAGGFGLFYQSDVPLAKMLSRWNVYRCEIGSRRGRNAVPQCCLCTP
jgi:hypothetical protein